MPGASERRSMWKGRATLRELNRAFDKAGINLIDPTGQPFDPNWHEAMVAQESADPNHVPIHHQKRGIP